MKVFFIAPSLYHNFVNISTVLKTNRRGSRRKAFAGSNLSTDPKWSKCIYKNKKRRNLRFVFGVIGQVSDSLFCGKATAVEKPHRGFPKSRLSSPSINKPKQKTPAGVVFCFGRDSWTRTNEMQESKSCALTDLAISLYLVVTLILYTLFFALSRQTRKRFGENRAPKKLFSKKMLIFWVT